MIIYDSGVYIEAVIEERFSVQATALINYALDNEIPLHAPTLLRYELLSVARKLVFQKRLTAADGTRVRDQLLQYSIELHMDDELLLRAYELATELNQPRAYDTQYLALAERLDCDYWTADERFFNSAKSQFPRVCWLANFTPPDDPA